MIAAGFDHCLDLLRRYDRDRYLAVLYLPAPVRPAVAALYAFDVEIGRIPALVSEPAPGEIRLQWWREVIEGRRESGNHPVAATLIEAIDRHDLPVATFCSYLEARVFDLYHDPMPDRAAFEGYCGETASALLTLSARCAGAASGENVADACGHGGVAQTVAATLRQLAAQRHQRRCFVPADLLAEAGLTVDEWLNAAPSPRHLAAVGAFIDWGRAHLAGSRAAMARAGGGLGTALLALAPVEAWLAGAERAGMAVFSRPPEVTALRRHWLFLRAALRA
ncbi:MAG: phytoene synthase [Alphaproteobacteria bacterium]|nr:MAG: phytoene synthase [Alphaproteobacteria bacterium]